MAFVDLKKAFNYVSQKSNFVGFKNKSHDGKEVKSITKMYNGLKNSCEVEE